MLKESKEGSELVTLHYELYKMTGNKTHRIEALKIYHKLYEKTPNIKYKEKIEELG